MTITSPALPPSSPDPAAPEDTACPRCGGGFHCGVNDGHCACFGLRLSDTLKATLSARYPDRCLCVGCLAELAAREPGDEPGKSASGHPLPTP
ncbi:MAG: cysteine-rich CWC family protein [Burkholderiaceae bacterium]